MPIVIGGILTYIASFSVLSFLKYASFDYTAFDLAYYHQIFWRTLHGEFFSQTMVPHLSLGYHVEAIIPALVPFYALFPDPRTLLILQSVALALPALPIYLIAKHRLGALSSSLLRSALPLFFPFAWLLSPFVHAVNLDEFHLTPFALAPLFFAFLAYEKNKRITFALLLVGALLVHESVAAVVIALGVLAWAERRSSWWMLFPAVLGGAWHLFAIEIILRFNPDRTLSLVSGIAPFLLRIVSPDTIMLLLAFGMPFFLMPFFRPKRLVLTVLPLLQMLSVGDVGVRAVETASVALLLPGVFLAAIEGAKAFPRVAHAVYGVGSDDRREAVFVLLTTAMVYAMVTLGPVPALIGQLATGDRADVAEAARTIAASVAPTDGVAAPPPLLSHLSGRYELTPLPNAEVAAMDALRNLPPSTEVVIIDARASQTDGSGQPFISIQP
jgi:uncharacterized membrane protein